MTRDLFTVASIVLGVGRGPADPVMWPYVRRVFSGLVIASALLSICILASLFRPSESLAVPPPAKPVGRWLWFDRAVRFERWHPPLTVSGTYTSSGSFPDTEVFVSRRDVTYDVTSQPNGTLVVRTFDFWQLNLWSAAAAVVPLTGVFAIATWYYRRKSPGPIGVCRACGYDLRASKERCPECGTPILSNVEESPK